MVTLRRYLSLLALLFWQGGFTFYGAVVVPITRQVLKDHMRLALAAEITGPVTNGLNWAGVLTLAVLLWDLAVAADASRRRYRLRCGAWAFLFVSLGALFVLHYVLDKFGPLEGIPEPDQFAFWKVHQSYLVICALQWGAGLTYLGLSLSAWRSEDQHEAVREKTK